MTVYTGRTFQTCALRTWGVWVSMRDFHAATVRYKPGPTAVVASGSGGDSKVRTTLGAIAGAPPAVLGLSEETESEGVATGIQDAMQLNAANPLFSFISQGEKRTPVAGGRPCERRYRWRNSERTVPSCDSTWDSRSLKSRRRRDRRRRASSLAASAHCLL